MLVRCLYASRACQPGNAETVSAILEESRKRNAAIGVTGVLCLADDVFIQLLEGGRDEVSELYNKIANDKRHRNVRLLTYNEIKRRRFAQWSMGAVDVAGLNAGVLLKYFRREKLDPFEAPGETTLALLLELVETGVIGGRSEGV